MKRSVCVTARGNGTWGWALDVELVTELTTRFARDGLRSHTATMYSVITSDPALGKRGFTTEAERAAFLAASFTDLRLNPVEQCEPHERPHVLNELVGRDLAAVVFVGDYIQLQFDNSRVNLYIWPRIWRAGSLLKHPAEGYNDALIALIGRRLDGVDEILDLGLVFDLEHEHGAMLSVPLDGTDLVGPEVAEFAGTEWIVWRPGDEPIEWLPCP